MFYNPFDPYVMADVVGLPQVPGLFESWRRTLRAKTWLLGFGLVTEIHELRRRELPPDPSILTPIEKQALCVLRERYKEDRS